VNIDERPIDDVSSTPRPVWLDSTHTTAEQPGLPGTLLSENDSVRIWELVMEPGATCDWHMHAPGVQRVEP
jgi:hypothetical protein